MYAVFLVVGVLFCLLSAFGVVAFGPMDTFKLGVAVAFGSFLAHYNHYHPHA